MKSKILGLLAVGLLAGPMAASAITLDGMEFTAQRRNDNGIFPPAGFSPSSTFVVGNGAEVTYTPLGIQFDFTSDGLVITGLDWSLLGTFNGFEFFANSPLGITGVSLIDSTGVTGFDASDFSITSTSITLNMAGISATAGHATFAFIFANDVPEPGTLALLGLGLAGLGLSRRRKAV